MICGRALCARCRTEFEKTNPRQIYCSVECRRAASKENEQERIAKRRALVAAGLTARRRPSIGIEDVMSFCEQVKRETGRYIQYGQAVEIIEGRRKLPTKGA